VIRKPRMNTDNGTDRSMRRDTPLAYPRSRSFVQQHTCKLYFAADEQFTGFRLVGF
jgi:hypothetical protein